MKPLWPFVAILTLFYVPALVMTFFKDRQHKYACMRNAYLRKCYNEEAILNMQRFYDELSSRPNSIITK